MQEEFNIAKLDNLPLSQLSLIAESIIFKLVKDQGAQIQEDDPNIGEILKHLLKILLSHSELFKPQLLIQDAEELMICGLKRFKDVAEAGIDNQQLNFLKTSLLSLHARLFTLVNSLSNQNSARFTPFRTNLLTIGQLLEEAQNIELEDQEYRKNFAREFWSCCSCEQNCHTKALFRDALYLHSEFRKKPKNQIFNELGAVLANNRKALDETHVQKHRFIYAVGGAKVCKAFFSFVYGVSRTTIETLQNRIKQGETFDLKWKSNKTSDSQVMENLEIFLNNKIEVWAMPNPKGEGADFFLPCNFSWKETYYEFIKFYQESFEIEKNPLSWSSYFKFYTETYDTVAKLSLKTDYCNSCCKLKINLENLKGINLLSNNEIDQNLLHILEAMHENNLLEDSNPKVLYGIICEANNKLTQLKLEFENGLLGNSPEIFNSFLDEAIELRIKASEVLKVNRSCDFYGLDKHFRILDHNLTKIELNSHLEIAKKARSAYSSHRQMTALEEGKYIISFDYSENILLPHLVNEPGIFYFKSRRRSEVFGIVNEKMKKQMNYIIDEGFTIGKGPNSVISMIDYYLNQNIPTGSNLVFYCDNCPGQNKNRDVIAYFTYLVKVAKKYSSIELYFMVSGHSRFTPDGNFGNLKAYINKSNCYSVLDLLGVDGCVQKSSSNNTEIVYKILLQNKKTLIGMIGKAF